MRTILFTTQFILSWPVSHAGRDESGLSPAVIMLQALQISGVMSPAAGFVAPPSPLLGRVTHGMTRKDLETVLGRRGRVSEILTKKRNLSLEMIRRLHRKLHIPLESLIGTAA